ncbi:MAG: NAD(P)-dependent glycerol-3-phosphate dehydrogenase [Deltaproteobacteria bacterium]|nr:NAD(P)-dependent glycerol-3-phosphate dehydrogenase [Deltaproteobacteria bacterium]
MEKIGIIGAGSFGTSLSILLANKGYSITLWVYETELVQEIKETRRNSIYLPDFEIPTPVEPTNDLEKAVSKADLILQVMPSHVVRSVMEQAYRYFPRDIPIVSASKGIEIESLMTVDEILFDILPGRFHKYLAYISGPSFAKEVAAGIPTAVVATSRELEIAKRVQETFSAPSFRVYTSEDVAGVELGGALKNVIAIAAGTSAGLGLGLNTQAALVTRGLAELARLAVKKGANPLTLSGLAGMGDLVLTCYGELSRNRTVGFQLGQGKKLNEILSSMKMVAEGVKTTKAAYRLSKKEGVEMPITEQMHKILYEDATPADAVFALMTRTLKHELEY